MKQLFAIGMQLPLLDAADNHIPHHLLGLGIVIVALCLGFIIGKRHYKRHPSNTADAIGKAPIKVTQTDAEDAANTPATPITEAATTPEGPTAPTPHKETATPTVEESKVIDPEFIARARAVVAQHLDDSDWTIEAFAREMKLSQPVFSNKLRTQTGMLPNDLIREIRMEEACRLIRAGGHDIATISYMVGFSDPKYFTRVFKKQYGVPPSKFREEAKA